jgi:transketolase
VSRENGISRGADLAGIANAVGLAIAQAHMGAVFNKDGFTLIDNHTFGELGAIHDDTVQG